MHEVKMGFRTGILFIFFLAIASGLSAAAAQQLYTPQKGSAERKAILNTLRPALEARLGKPVEFAVSFMNASRGWVFLGVSPQRPGGGKIRPADTVFAGQLEYMDGLNTLALLRFDYGRWNLIDHAIGPTDAFWQGDPLYQRIPQEILTLR
ncbi:MAG: hypothetical protein ABJN26_07105 [Stappiaceae bacterium]